MKPQSLNRSFGKTMAAFAIAFTIFTASAHAQERHFVGDCMYVTVYNQAIPVSQPGYMKEYRVGCNVGMLPARSSSTMR
jgi:hypothetical protein